LSDAELLTLAVIQALLGFSSEARFIRHAHAHLRAWFPYLPDRPGYNKRLRRAGEMFQHVIAALARDCPSWNDDLWLVDSTPVEVRPSGPAIVRLSSRGAATTMTKKRRRHTPEQIIRKLDEGHRQLPLASGMELDEVCRHLEIAESTWHRWLAQYGGMKASDAKRLRELEGENARLKKLVANQALDIDMLKEIAKGEF
jgi:hypothetical protein